MRSRPLGVATDSIRRLNVDGYTDSAYSKSHASSRQIESSYHKLISSKEHCGKKRWESLKGSALRKSVSPGVFGFTVFALGLHVTIILPKNWTVS